ncbi:LOW QUALITY PROTEIN: MAX dimerization protein MGA a [Siniperca chuatsi]|uniref:LOW QUALITY PROTEIN: MAX dimerization protein MGA a n=1 Tax=Siniperca chuatsi TaxID=119488 RepID=UPI001CE1D02A|nr:LOW QUALITY PROTEIN: MAX dimerization protein MGA a [Siniperca chuatsi]
MASKKKQKGMVYHQEGATTPAAAPAGDHLPACFVVPKPGKASEGGMEQSTRVTDVEADMMGKPIMYPSKEAIRTSGGLPASSNPQSDNLSPDSICKGIRVTLDNNSMWNEFFRCKTEMILTKQGSRMFPYCRFRISGLHASRKYSLIMDIQPLDNSHYKWTGKSWQVAGKAECHLRSPPFAHPESPSTGQHWMQNPVSFYKLKLTNNMSDQEGNTILHPMHRYLPRLHVVQTDKAAKDIKLDGPNVVTFTFPQTEFMAVTAYQNSRFAQLKVEYNPFAKGLKEDGSSSWGLKLKLNSGKDGGTTTKEQHPVKKSLKSLLANHKPRSSKTVDSKPSVSGELQKNSTTNKDQSAAKVTGECSCSNSRPAQKLFSELIREAHVSLQRCNLEQLGINNSTSHRTEQTNTKTTALKNNVQDVPKRDSISVKTHSETSSAKKGETTKRKVKEHNNLLNSLNCKDNVRTDCSEVINVVAASAVSENSSVDSDHQPKHEASSEVKVKQQKRPLPLPLPALALFLKQHSTKSKKAKSKPYFPPPALPPESLSESQSSAAASACPPSDHAGSATGLSKDLTCDITKCDNQASGRTGAHLHPDEMVFSVPGQAVKTAHQPSSPSCPDAVATTDPKGPRTDDFLASISFGESPGPEPAVPDVTPVLPNSHQPFCTLGTSISTMYSTLTTCSASPILSPPFDTVLPAPNSPQTPTITESSSLPSDYPTMKSDSLLPDPECSSFGFEPLSPASSPEPLPSLPTSLALELNSTISETTPKAVPPEELPHGEDSASAACVFKWHTVLPPPKPYIDTSFTPFQSTPQPLPLASVTSPLLRSETPSDPEPQTLDTSTSTPPPDPAPSFQENEQLLPFPAELSPLALQLPLSPTFSSLDGEGLSPTPSIADLVYFFSTDDDLGMGVEFSNTETVAVPCPPPNTVQANAHEPSQQVQPIQANKPSKRKKKSQRRKLAKTDMDQEMDDSTYASMQPNLEEVEEQLFISFTSKEALKLHTVDPSEETGSQPETTAEGHLQQTADAPENAETAEGLKEKIAAFEKILLRDLKLMRHRQVIHPVLQEVGLKMNLLDPSLAIDLQYLGVRLPIPPPGVSLEPLTQELPPPQGVSAAFVSRTGKTTDVTQIKGWREKFTPSEAPSALAPAKPEAGPSSDLPKKNLSAFCSDMLDEYLENEGKLIDERAASFSEPTVEPVVYELPTRSTSYVRTLDSILKKQTVSSPTSDLISGFIPPSKRPKPTLKETKTSRRENTKQKGPKHNRLRAEPAAAPVSTPVLSPADSNLVPKQPAAPPTSEHTAPATEPHKSKKHHLKVQFGHTELSALSPQTPAFKKRKKLKPKTSSQTLSPPRSTAPPPGVSEDMAPLESDSELGAAIDHNNETCRKDGWPVMTRALLKQKDLEDGVVWEGRPRTSITEERAAVALTSLFTLMGFVSENPTAPIQLARRRAPPCLNEFCRLGCVCSSLAHCSRISHCGRPPCMLGCSCLKQKVVLLKNLDGSDSSPSHHENNKKKKRKRRMKMAYILKEADSVSQPAERVRTLWKRDGGDLDPDPIHVPEPASLSRPTERRGDNSSCARVRGYRGKKKMGKRKQKESSKDVKSKGARLKALKQRDLTLEDTKTKPSCPPPAGEPVQPAPSDRPPSPPAEPTPKPSKRLIILAECKWPSDADRNHVLKKLCEAMALDRLDEPFWIRKYLISPISQTVEESGADSCIQYKIHISRPQLEQGKPAAPEKPPHQGKPRETKQQQQDRMKQVLREAEPLEDWQREVEEEEEAEPLEDWQREVEEEEEAGPLEDWQREVEEGDIEEEVGSTVYQVDDGRESSRKEMKMRSKKKEERVSMALPFLTGISPAGFLSANRKQPGGTDHLVQVNGKLYPLAKIQLGKMGALHPANRLAAYLTGRVGSNRKQQGSSSSSSPSKPPQNQSSGPTPQTVSLATSVVSGHAATPPPRSQPSVTVLTLPSSPTVVQPAAVKVDQSATSSDPPAGEAPECAGSRVVTVAVYPGPTGGSSQARVVPAASGSSAPTSDSQVSSSVVPPVNPAPKGSQLLMVQVPGPHGKLPVPALAPCSPLPPSTGQRMVLQPVQAASGLQYYRRPDGKLVQLVPISQLRSNLSVQRGSPSPSVLPAASCETPVVTVGNQTPPATTATTSSPPPCPASSPSPWATSPPRSGPPLVSWLRRGRTPLKSSPATPARNQSSSPARKFPLGPPTVVTTAGSFTILQPHPPSTPMNLISLKPSTGQGAEPGVKTVTVSAVPVGQKPAETNTTTIQTPAGNTHRPPPPPPAPPGSEVTPLPPPCPPADRVGPETELACNLVDLDIICVDDEAGLVTTETEGVAKRSLDAVELEGSLNIETENSSDFGDETGSGEETESVINIHRHIHNELEKQRRGKMLQLFEGLRREVGLSEEKTSKISTLQKAVQVIQELRTTETDLEKKKRRLMKMRDDYLTTITPTTEESRQVTGRRQRSPESVTELSERGGTGSTDTGSMEADLLDETDELTDNSSDEERAVAKTPNVTNAEDEVQSVAMETGEESSQLSAARRRLASVTRNVDSERSLSVKKLVRSRSVTAAFKALSSVMNTKNSPKRLLKLAHTEIQTLQSETARLRSLKICLNQQRNAYIREISQRSGESEQRILRKLQRLSSKQRTMETQERGRAANQAPAAAGGGASDPPVGDTTDDDIITPSVLRQQTPQAPPTPVSAPPTTTPAQTPVPQPQTNSQRVLQASKPAPPGVSHNALAARDRPRTIPNILSRSKNPAPPSPKLTKPVEESASFQALLPAEVLSLVRGTLPGQPVLTLSPLMTGPTVLQTSPTPGVASVTLNFPSLTNQQIHLTSLPSPPTGKICSSSAPLTVTNLTAANFNNLLQLVQSSTPQPQQPPQQQQVLAGQPPPPPVVSAGSDLFSDQIAESSSSSSPPSSRGPSSSPCPDPSAGRRVAVGGPLGAEQQQQGETREDADNESLTSLLNEIVFLNQQTVTTAMTAGVPLPGKPSSEAGRREEGAAVGRAEEQGRAHSPWLLQLDSDSDDTVTAEEEEEEEEEAGLNDHTETTQSGPQPGPANGNAKGGVLAPPPLLQMKVGGAKVADPASSDGAAGGEGGRGGRRGGGVAWRPMPRLVPLGLRGNPPS